MASTRTPAEALDIARQHIRYQPIERDGLAVRVLDDINKLMWVAAPWRWTLGSMPQVTLVSGEADYPVTLPDDFLYLAQAVVFDGKQRTPLEIVPALPVSSLVGIATQISVEQIVDPDSEDLDPPLVDAYRVHPVPATLPASVTPVVHGLYKREAPQIVEENLAEPGVLVFPDEWFWVYVEGVLWRATLYGGGLAQSGNIQVTSNGQSQYNGFAGSFMAALNFMRDREPLPLLDARTIPDPKIRDK